MRKLIDAHSYHRADCTFIFAPLDVCFCVTENMAEEIMRLQAENERLREAVGKLRSICLNRQPDKISDGVKIADDALKGSDQ